MRTLYNAEGPGNSDTKGNGSGEAHLYAANPNQEVESPSGTPRKLDNEYPAMPCTRARHKHREIYILTPL